MAEVIVLLHHPGIFRRRPLQGPVLTEAGLVPLLPLLVVQSQKRSAVVCLRRIELESCRGKGQSDDRDQDCEK
jgi:hypothetical protein